MGKGSINENNNVYFKARKKAAAYNERLYSREGASELLGISVSTLADYELGNTKVVPVDKVVLMAEMCNDSQKRQGISRVPGNRQYALVQIWYRMEKKAPARPQIVTAPRAKTAPSRSDSTGNRLPLPRHNDRICHFPAQPIISPLNRIKRFPAPVSAPQAYYDCCHSHM